VPNWSSRWLEPRLSQPQGAPAESPQATASSWNIAGVKSSRLLGPFMLVRGDPSDEGKIRWTSAKIQSRCRETIVQAIGPGGRRFFGRSSASVTDPEFAAATLGHSGPTSAGLKSGARLAAHRTTRAPAVRQAQSGAIEGKITAPPARRRRRWSSRPPCAWPLRCRRGSSRRGRRGRRRTRRPSWHR